MKRALSDADADAEDAATDSTEDEQWLSLAGMGFPQYEATCDGRVRRREAAHEAAPELGPEAVPEAAPEVAPPQCRKKWAMDDGARWRPIDEPGMCGYEVSDDGRMRNGRSGRVQSDRRGHVRVYAKGSRRGTCVGRLVAQAFLGDAPPGWRLEHLNGDVCDSRVVNLCYTSAVAPAD